MQKTKELLGGQALIEGVMMKGPRFIAYAVYNPQGKLITKKQAYVALTKKYKFLNIFILRGFLNLCEMLAMGLHAITYSAEIALPEEMKNQSKYEMPLSMLFAVLISFVLFIFLPASAFTYLKPYIPNTLLLNLTEGSIRIAVFLGFLLSVSLTKDMQRVFSYHGAEHMTVHAYEAGDKLIPARVKKYSTLHPRCGTSFLLVVFLVSIVVFSFLGRPDLWHRILYKILLLPLIAGISYEGIRLVCRLPRLVMLACLWPGLLLQKLTTRRPDQKMLIAAIKALRLAEGNS